MVGRGEHEEDGRRYVSLAGLRMRGWTTGDLVHRLLGPPDRLSIDPRVRTAPAVRLYRVERVEAAERSHEFRQRAEALERIRTEPIDVPRLDPGKLALRAVGHRAREELRQGRTGDEVCTGRPRDRVSRDRASLDPWKVGYLRERVSSAYDLLLAAPTRPGNPDQAAHGLLQQRICDAIAEAYPALAEECARQAAGPGAEEGGDVAAGTATREGEPHTKIGCGQGPRLG
ncbi:hypothetical protein [Streptomyces sp. NPDC046909]|uniref:hypothetical protein n=1 Tax=Streptomyces sp. NPDC046909 TaxID=3155617 RepID=UPI0033F56EA1